MEPTMGSHSLRGDGVHHGPAQCAKGPRDMAGRVQLTQLRFHAGPLGGSGDLQYPPVVSHCGKQ